MITIMRRYFKGSANVVLWLIVAAFIIGLMPLAFKQISDTAIWAVKVNGEQIGIKEYNLEKEQQKNRILAFRNQYGEYADWLLSVMGMSDPQALAVKAVARRELINQCADSLGIHVSDAYIFKKMSDPLFVTQEFNEIIPPQIVDPIAGINQEMLRRYLKYTGLTTDLLERQIERILTEKLVTNIVQASLYVPLFDIKQKYLSEHANKSFSILEVSVSDYEKELGKMPIAEGDLEQFYNQQNKELQRYMVPEKRSGKVWTFTPQSYGIAISQDQIAAYYEKNKVARYTEKPATIQVRRIVFAVNDPAQRIATQEKAARTKDELVADQSQFMALAQRFSAQKEIVTTFVRGQQEASLDKAAFTLAKDGDISDVIETKQGFEIIQRISKNAPVYKAFSLVEKEINKELQSQEFEGLFAADIKRVIDKDESLAAFIAEKGGVAKEAKEVALDDTALAKNLFSLKPGQKGFYIDGQLGVALVLDTVIESYIPSLDAIKKTVTTDYYRAQAIKKIKEDLKQAKESLKLQPIADIKKAVLGATIIRTGMLNPSNQEGLEPLKNKGIPVESMLQMEKIESAMVHVGDLHGFLMRLDEIEPFNEAYFQEKRAGIIGELETLRGQQVMEGFVASLYRNATIETNESVITLQA